MHLYVAMGNQQQHNVNGSSQALYLLAFNQRQAVLLQSLRCYNGSLSIHPVKEYSLLQVLCSNSNVGNQVAAKLFSILQLVISNYPDISNQPYGFFCYLYCCFNQYLLQQVPVNRQVAIPILVYEGLLLLLLLTIYTSNMQVGINTRNCGLLSHLFIVSIILWSITLWLAVVGLLYCRLVLKGDI